jgi:sugar/nucleoside kinase (ribokinase family)
MFAPLPVVARGDSGCSELPKLCTDPVMFYGVVTTMTYLCPDKTNGLITVTVTTTGTTTVTEVPTDAVLTRTTTITEVPTDDIFAPSSSVYVLECYLTLLFTDLAGPPSVFPRSLRPPSQRPPPSRLL